jgi:acyl-CoA thioester hydrolase
MALRFDWPVRVYWEDTDGGGIVYHSVYLNYFERARTEWLRARGLDQRSLRDRERVQFAVVDMNVRWARPARFDDLLTASAELTERGGASFSFSQQLTREGELLCEATVRVAVVDADSLKPRRLPDAVLERIAP